MWQGYLDQTETAKQIWMNYLIEGHANGGCLGQNAWRKIRLIENKGASGLQGALV
jgi:hypothetical protein